MTARIEWVELNLNAPTINNDEFPPDGAMFPPVNFVPMNGRLLPRERWLPNVDTGLPDPLTSRGMHLGWREGGADKEIQVVHYDGTNFDFWAQDVTDDGSPEVGGSWTSRDANVVVSAAYRGVPVAFAVGQTTFTGTADCLYYGNPGFSSGRGRYQDSGGSAFQIATNNTAGYAAAYHLSRFWIGGCADFPGRLKFSEIGDVNSWNVSENFINVGGVQVAIFDIVTWDRGLVIGKGDGLWFLGGSTLDSFQLVPISDIGVGPGRSMCVTPYGVFFVGHDSVLYLWNGGEVKRVTKDYVLINSLAGVSAGGSVPGNFWSLAWVADRLFIGRSDSGYLDVYIPGSNLWYQEQIGGGFHSVGRWNENYVVMMPAVSGTDPYTAAAFKNLVDTPGQYDRILTNESVSGLVYSAQWGEQSPNPLKGKATLREIAIRYRQHGADPSAETGVALSAFNDRGEVSTKTIGAKATAGIYTDKPTYGLEGATGERVQVSLEALPAETDEDGYEIHQILCGYLVDEDRR